MIRKRKDRGEVGAKKISLSPSLSLLPFITIRPKIPAGISGNFHGRMAQTFPVSKTTSRAVLFAWK